MQLCKCTMPQFISVPLPRLPCFGFFKPPPSLPITPSRSQNTKQRIPGGVCGTVQRTGVSTNLKRSLRFVSVL